MFTAVFLGHSIEHDGYPSHQSGTAKHWFIGKKSPTALFSDSSFVAAGKRRDFYRLPRPNFTANVNKP
jgi:hypothetical protein